jgi:tetratricopeptide (TPR) repeat protein
MILKWLDASKATEIGNVLADDCVLRAMPELSGARAAKKGNGVQGLMQRFFQRIDRDARPLQLNVFQKAKLANSFKWRLLEQGVEKGIVDELTQALVVRLNERTNGVAAFVSAEKTSHAAPRTESRDPLALQAAGNEAMQRGDWNEAVRCYQALLEADDRHLAAHINLGAAFCKLGRYEEAERQFRRAVGLKSSSPEAQCNLGTILRWRGQIIESEMPLRRALKLKPAYVEAQINLGITLTLLGRWREAKTLLEKALRTAPNNVEGLVNLGQISLAEGNMAEAERLFRKAAQAEPGSASALAALASLRRMTKADAGWLESAEKLVEENLAPVDEASLRYAIGKYYDDVEDYGKAFRSYRRANELQKLAAAPYDREARTRFVDDMLRVYTRDVLAQPRTGASDSGLPVLVVGMPRSGTSLVEQIIASHPAARGAGELSFWSDSMRSNDAALRRAPPDESLVRKLGEGYLRLLGSHADDAKRVVDKATFNSEYLGVIQTVVPNARVIYLRRDPIDSCLSCYFQPFSTEMNFTQDLADLAHFYREHHRLIAHWRKALPAGVLLDVPYAELVADQEGWTRRILDFVGLEWDPRCLEFERTERTVLTVSSWQVRQKMFRSSVGRWRHYEKYIGPLLNLRDPDA